MKLDYEKLALFLGGLTLLLFAIYPYVLDLLVPSKSLGQIIGENTKGFIDGLKGRTVEQSPSQGKIVSELIIIFAFLSFVASMLLSAYTLQHGTQKWYGIGGGLLAIAGVGIYLFYLTVGLIGLLALGVVILLVLAIIGGSF